jgi:hypothetical protein
MIRASIPGRANNGPGIGAYQYVMVIEKLIEAMPRRALRRGMARQKFLEDSQGTLSPKGPLSRRRRLEHGASQENIL